MHRNNTSGFTLVELIVVTIIIGLLASVGIVSYRYVIDESRKSTAQSNITSVVNALESARTKTGKTFMQMTGSSCSFCTACNTGTSLKDVPEDHACAVRWSHVTTSISAASAIDITKITRDPWGSPYIADENDGEVYAHQPNPCNDDWIRSAGPDGIYGTADDIVQYLKPISRGCD